MKIVSGIYKITNKVNGKYYVGSSCDIYERWAEHKRLLNRNKHDSRHLNYSWNKYGFDNFNFDIIEVCEIKDLLIVEQRYLDVAKTEKNNVYNSSFTAGKVEFTEEVRRKMSLAKKGKFLGINNPLFVTVSLDIENKLKPIWIQYGKCKFLKIAKIEYGIGHKPAKRLIKKYRQDSEAVEKRKVFYKQNVKNTAGILASKRIGILHPNYKPEILKLKNQFLDETFIGTRNDFKNKYGFRLYPTKKNCCKGWELVSF